MLRLYLNERTNAEVNRCVVGELDRDVAPVGLVADGDLGDGLADRFCVLVYLLRHESSKGRGLWSSQEPLDINKPFWPSRLGEGHVCEKSVQSCMPAVCHPIHVEKGRATAPRRGST